MPKRTKPSASQIGRYQIALANSANENFAVCYIVDTTTGEVKVVKGRSIEQLGIPFERMKVV